MGLDTTHDAFHGAYSAFNRLRQAVAWAAGGSYPYHCFPDDYRASLRLAELGVADGPNRDTWFWLPDTVTRESRPGLYAFLSSNDCEGDFPPEVCKQMADDLEKLIPVVDAFPDDWGHIERGGGFGGVLRKYVAGCRLAAERGESLEYH